MSALHRNVVWLSMSQAATWLVSVVVLIVAPDRLQAVGYGEIGLATAFVGFFTLIASLGTTPFIARTVARDHSTMRGLVVAGVRLKLVIGPLASILAIALAKLLGYSDQVLILISIGCVGMIVLLVNEIVVAALNGMELMGRAALWQTVQVYVGTLSALVVLLTSQSVVAYSAAFVAASFIPLIANYFTIRPYLRTETSTTHVRWETIVRGGAPLLALGLLNLVYATIDIPILESVSGSEVVGWYTLAYRWVGMPIFVTTIVVTAFFPQLSALASTSLKKFTVLTNRAIEVIMVVTVPASVGIILIAEDLFNLLYGDQYDNSIVIMQILSIQIPITALNTVLAAALIASNRQNRYLWIAASAAILNPPLVFLAVRVTQNRYDNGGIGAALLTVCTEVFILCCALTIRTRGVLDKRTVWYCVRCVLAASAMAAPILLLSGSAMVVKVGVGAITYAACSIALGTASVSRTGRMIREIRAARSPGQESTNNEGNDEMSDAGQSNDG